MLLGTPASAQLCAGAASYEHAPFQLGLGAGFVDKVKIFSGGVGVGRHNSVFGDVGFGRASDAETSESTNSVDASVGYQIPLGHGERLQICPTFSASRGFGQSDVQGTDLDATSTGFSLGAVLGMVVWRSARVQFVPAVGLSYQLQRTTYKGSLVGIPINESDTIAFGCASVGAGFVFNRVLTVQPGLSRPFAAAGARTSYGIGVSLNLPTH